MFNAKNEFKLTPCRPPDPCDYDDCGSDDDITDKDLAVLLKEETEKAKTVNENADKDWDASKDDKEKKGKHNEVTKKKESNEGKEERGKKRPCRKIIKNPFFTNRLKFSTDLPPRPPIPPIQFLPLANEDSKPNVCPKKKKCKKKKKEPKTEFLEDKFCEEKEEELCEEKEEELCEEKEEELCEEETYEVESENFSPPCQCCDEEAEARRRCKKPKENQAPCRKKISNTSIPPQPRRIPALLKDLPLICPRDIPEVERQIHMSNDCNFQKNSCKKKCKNKEKVEQLLNQ